MPKSKAAINIQNVVATGTLNQKVDLDTVMKINPGVEYLPELFLGLIYRFDEPKVVILLSTSGNLVVTEAKKDSDFHDTVHKLHASLEEENLIFYE